MTISATPTSFSEVLEELGSSEAFPYTFPDAKTRWLADVGSSDPITFPTDFASKTSCKVVDTATAGSSSGNSIHQFSGVNFGIAFPGRVLIACIGLYVSGSEVLDQVSCTIGGQSATGGDAGENLSGGPSCGAGIWAASLDSGTSGNVIIDWNGATNAALRLVMLSVSGISPTPFSNTSGWNGGGSGGTGKTRSIGIPTNGLLIAAVAHTNDNPVTFSGVTKREEIISGSRTLSVAFDNRKDSEASDTIGASWSGSTAYGGEGRSYSQ